MGTINLFAPAFSFNSFMQLKKRLNPATHCWLTDEGAQAIFTAIGSAHGVARFVGGAVRDALLGREVQDIDLAVTLPPDKVVAALKKAGINTIPTGIEHGTVTAVTGGKSYEITTLRQDVETYGRRAKVAFSDDWLTDASRRDFTINALYADADGNVFDYFNGLKDLKAGKIRFIGKASDRIHEDVLRILRFFRFFAWFGHGPAGREELQACKELSPLLGQLSAERVWKELKRLLLAPDPVPALRLMETCGALAMIFPEGRYMDGVEELVRLERVYRTSEDSIRRLSALIRPDEKSVKILAKRLRLSRAEADGLHSLVKVVKTLEADSGSGTLRRMMYAEGREAVQDGLFLLAARKGKTDLKTALDAVKQWKNPVFPLQGADVVKLGVKPGPRVGNILRTVEAWWIEKDFQPSRAACLKKLRTLAD